MIRILVALMLLGSASAQLAAAPACVADKCTKSSNADADCCNDDAIATAAGCAAGHTLYDPTSAGGYNNQNECTGTGDFAAVTLGMAGIRRVWVSSGHGWRSWHGRTVAPRPRYTNSAPNNLTTKAPPTPSFASAFLPHHHHHQPHPNLPPTSRRHLLHREHCVRRVRLGRQRQVHL